MCQAKAEIPDGCKGEAGGLTRKALGHPAPRAYFLAMPAVATRDLASLIAEEAAALPADKQSSVLDYVLFIKQQVRLEDEPEEDGDAIWERLLSDPKKTASFAAWAEEAMKEGPSEPLDLSKL